MRSSTIPNPFQPDARAGRGGAREGGGESDELDEDQTPQQRAAQRSALSDSEDPPVSTMLVDSDIDPYPDDAVPLGLLAKLSISTSQDGSSQAATRGDNANADDDDVVRYTRRVLLGKEEKGQIRNFYLIILLIGCRQQVVFHTRPRTEPQVAKVAGRQDERTRHFGP